MTPDVHVHGLRPMTQRQRAAIVAIAAAGASLNTKRLSAAMVMHCIGAYATNIIAALLRRGLLERPTDHVDGLEVDEGYYLVTDEGRSTAAALAPEFS